LNNTVSTPQATHRAIIHTDENGEYWAEIPELPGCFTQGETLDEVYRNLQEAVACHLDLTADQVRVSVLEFAA
jgi:predicted RNase H-like HicB family nuclease